MDYPSNLDFLEVFGLDATDVDASTLYRRYSKSSDDGALRLDFSFCEIENSFQVTLYLRDAVVMVVSSENVRSVTIQRGTPSSIHVVFGVEGAQSEATITLAPEIHCHWWTIKHA